MKGNSEQGRMMHICLIAPGPRSSLLSLSNIGLVSSTWLYQDFSAAYWLVFNTTSPNRIATLSIIIASCSARLRRTKSRASASGPLRPGAGEPVEQAVGDARADEVPDVAAERADLLDETRRDELVAIGGHQKDGFDIRVQPGVHAGHLELVLEIGHGAQPADDDAGADRLGEFHQKRVEGSHLDALGAAVFEVLHFVAHDLDALVGREERSLGVVARDAEHEVIDDVQRAPDDVGMAVGDRVER